MIDFFRLFALLCTAFIIGKLITKLKLPAILGWLITGIVFGPYLIGIVPESILTATWFHVFKSAFECFAGLMIGAEIVFKKIKKFGSQIFVTTLTQSLGTFFIVSAVFAVTFAIMHMPIYVAFIFGGIALATAPAPAISIVNEFHTKGPVTDALLPMAALDDVVGVCVFFTVISIVASTIGGTNTSPLVMIGIILFPFVIGIAVGVIAGFMLRKDHGPAITLVLLLLFLGICIGIALVIDYLLLPAPALNYLLMGMAFSATFANIVSEDRLKEIMRLFNPILSVSLLIVIVNLGMPLNYKSIMGAGIFTAVYIIARAVGKISGAAFGGAITKAPSTVKKYLGLTLLPHSGVSLVFTGMAVTSLAVADPASAAVIQGTIVAAAIINEIIAVIISKQAFKLAGEIPKESAVEPPDFLENATLDHN